MKNPKTEVDNYIIRVYRRESENPEQIIGIVEIVSTAEARPFTDLDELRDILTARGKKVMTPLVTPARKMQHDLGKSDNR